MMAAKLRKVKKNKKYPIDRSPLYGLQKRARLARLLRIDLKDLKHLLAGNDNYRVFERPKRDGGARQVEDPKETLKLLHRRFLWILSRVETPGYLHSGVKGRSYVSNSRQHIGPHPVAKIDIRKFFPATTFDHVKRGFAKAFGCSPDVAYLIARLCTFQNHLPTGSPMSVLVAYYAHKRMFDSLFRISARRGWTLTCYVDDITISGLGVNRFSLVAIRKEIGAAGLSCHKGKERIYAKDEPKLVTGVIVDASGVKLPNTRQRAIFDKLSRFRAETAPEPKGMLARELAGRANEAAQVDARFMAPCRGFAKSSRSLDHQVAGGERPALVPGSGPGELIAWPTRWLPRVSEQAQGPSFHLGLRWKAAEAAAPAPGRSKRPWPAR
jgi:hypothetical protein